MPLLALTAGETNVPAIEEDFGTAGIELSQLVELSPSQNKIPHFPQSNGPVVPHNERIGSQVQRSVVVANRLLVLRAARERISTPAKTDRVVGIEFKGQCQVFDGGFKVPAKQPYLSPVTIRRL